MRHVFDNICSVYNGVGSATPGRHVGDFKCHLVLQDGIQTFGPGSVALPYWLTIKDYCPVGSWEVPGFGMDASLADIIAVPSGSIPKWWVFYSDQVIWHRRTPYFRAYLSPLPLPGGPATQLVLRSGSLALPRAKLFAQGRSAGGRLAFSPRGCGQNRTIIHGSQIGSGRVVLHQNNTTYPRIRLRAQDPPHIVERIVFRAGCNTLPIVRFWCSGSSPPSAQVNYRQSAKGSVGGSGGNIAVTFLSPVLSGSCIAVHVVSFNDVVRIYTVGDSQSGTYTLGNNAFGLSGSNRWFVRPNVASGSFQVNVNGAASFTNVIAVELTGANLTSPLGAGNTPQFGSSTTPSDGGVGTWSAGQVLLNGVGEVTTVTSGWLASSPYAMIQYLDGIAATQIGSGVASDTSISSSDVANWTITAATPPSWSSVTQGIKP